jgi:hypothetical protein
MLVLVFRMLLMIIIGQVLTCPVLLRLAYLVWA